MQELQSEQHLRLPILQNSESSACAAAWDPGPPAPAIVSIQAARAGRLPLPLADFCALSTIGKCCLFAVSITCD